MVIFIDTSNGSNKLLRLFAAIVISALYLAVLALVRPFRRDDDAALAYVASLLLICVFASGIILQLCEEGRWGEMTCDDFVGLSSSYSASVFVVSLSATMFVVFCLFNLSRIVLALTMPTLRLASSGRPPMLALPKKQHFHLFLSHVWSTGQDQVTHALSCLSILPPLTRLAPCKYRPTHSCGSCSSSCLASASGSTWSTYRTSASWRSLWATRRSSSCSSPRATLRAGTAGSKHSL